MLLLWRLFLHLALATLLAPLLRLLRSGQRAALACSLTLKSKGPYTLIL